MKTYLRQSVVVLAFFIITLAGCSFSYLYRQLDWLVPWYVSDYITLDEQQQSELEKRLLAQLDWHCSTQLQRYAGWLRQLHDTPDAFTREQLERHYDTTQIFWRDLMTRVAPDAATILSQASDEQIDELVSKLKRKQWESEKELSEQSSDALASERIKRMIRLLERWLGKLEPAQRHLVTTWSDALGKQRDTDWRRSRRNWQQNFMSALLHRREGVRFTRQLHTLLVTPEELWSDSYRREYRQQKERTLDMLAAVAAQMTPLQHSHLQHELLSLADELQSLACKPGRKAER
jgi:hypothetical protein